MFLPLAKQLQVLRYHVHGDACCCLTRWNCASCIEQGSGGAAVGEEGRALPAGRQFC